MQNDFAPTETVKKQNKVFSACIDVMGTDAGTLYVCAETLEAAYFIIRGNLGSEVTYVGKLRENSLPAKNWPSETYAILGESEGLLFPVDEDAEEAEQAEAEIAWQYEQMETLWQSEQDDADHDHYAGEYVADLLAGHIESEMRDMVRHFDSAEAAQAASVSTFIDREMPCLIAM